MNVHAKERLYLSADRKKVVREGDRSAAYLLCAPGALIPEKYLHLIEEKEAPRQEPDPVENRETRVPKGLSKRSTRVKKGTSRP